MTRKLKIGYATKTTGRIYNRKTKSAPKLILQGNWFAAAGFAIGETVSLSISETGIKIERLHPTP